MHEAQEFKGDVDMLTGRAVLVSAVARTACEVYKISVAHLRRILNKMSAASDILLKAFLMRRQLDERAGIFAAGDVRCGSNKRVASAVGDGAMAVQFRSPIPGLNLR